MCYREKFALPTNRTADRKRVKYFNINGFEVIWGEYAIRTLSNQQLDDLRRVQLPSLDPFNLHSTITYGNLEQLQQHIYYRTFTDLPTNFRFFTEKKFFVEPFTEHSSILVVRVCGQGNRRHLLGPKLLSMQLQIDWLLLIIDMKYCIVHYELTASCKKDPNADV